MHPISNDLKSWYEQAGPDLFASTYIKVVGGTTWHWLGTCLRLVPGDFRLRTLYGRGVDWPISYDELEPFYARAEQEIGVSGDAADDLGAPRSGGYPMPAIPQTFLDKAFAEALAGTEYRVRPTPQGRLSQDQADRPACCGNASCIPVCPVQAKYDATIHLDRATAAGATLVAQATAVFVEVGPDRRVAAIRFKRWDGSEARAWRRRGVITRTSFSKIAIVRASQIVAASRRAGSALATSRNPGPRVGKFTSRMAASGTRTTSSRVFPCGRTKARTMTSMGISCAVAAEPSAISAARANRIDERTPRQVMRGSVYCRPPE